MNFINGFKDVFIGSWKVLCYIGTNDTVIYDIGWICGIITIMLLFVGIIVYIGVVLDDN